MWLTSHIFSAWEAYIKLFILPQLAGTQKWHRTQLHLTRLTWTVQKVSNSSNPGDSSDIHRIISDSFAVALLCVCVSRDLGIERRWERNISDIRKYVFMWISTVIVVLLWANVNKGANTHFVSLLLFYLSLWSVCICYLVSQRYNKTPLMYLLWATIW